MRSKFLQLLALVAYAFIAAWGYQRLPDPIGLVGLCVGGLAFVVLLFMLVSDRKNRDTKHDHTHKD